MKNFTRTRHRSVALSHCLLPVVFWLLTPGPATGAEDAATPFQSPGTRRMAERLERIAAAGDQDSSGNPYLNLARARAIQERIQQLVAGNPAPDQTARILNLQSTFAAELLRAGRTGDAIQEYEKLRTFIESSGMELGDRGHSNLRSRLALAWLRLGEQENCLDHHTIDSCLLPIREGGIHRLPRGSRAARDLLTRQLEEFPDDLKARWLLNLACMTLGEWPDGVSERWRIPPETFTSEHSIPRFHDAAPAAGLDLNTLAGGVVLEDFDNDGWLDLMVSAWGLRDPLRFFRNRGDGTFEEQTAEAGLTGLWGGLNLIQGDYNNDDWIDVLVLRGGWLGVSGNHPNSLLRNNGDGTFSDVTEEAGLLTANPTQTAVWFDFDGDGKLDLFIGNETTPGNINPCELFRNNGDGTFTEMAASAGITTLGHVKSVVAADYNNDGRPDLFISNAAEPNRLYRNDGPGTNGDPSAGDWKFTEVAAAAAVTEPVHSFTSWFFDYDNDGWPDIFVAGYLIDDVGVVAADHLGLPHNGTRARLFRNNRDGTFTDVTRESGLFRVLHAMSGNFGDLDNDGFLDFYVGTGDPDLSTLIPNRMFRNDGGKRFRDVTTAGGFGHLQKGHGIAFGDIDQDGDQDVYASMGGAYEGDFYRNALFENPGFDNRWIVLHLVGTRSNRAAIGARIRVTVETPDGRRAIHRTVGSGGSFGASPLRQEIGLGRATRIVEVRIDWPATGIRQEFRDLMPGRCYRITEDRVQAEPRPFRTFSLPSPETAPGHSGH